MKILRPLLRLTATVGILVLGLPALVLIPACLVDRDPKGEARGSLFPGALTALDPLTWDCAWNSALVALIVAGISVVIGLNLARITGPWRFWGRAPLRALIVAPVALGPFIAALGLRFLIDRFALVAWLNQYSGRSMLLGLTWESWLAWLNLVVADVLTGTVIVLWASETALSRVDPRWVEAGRALGASRYRAWRDLAWPNVRPFVARAAASVFLLTLLEPGAPLVANLPRTLAFQVVDSIGRADGINRGALLCLMAVGIGLLARSILAWRGGPIRSEAPASRPVARASWLRAGGSLLALGIWSALTLLPLVGLVLTLRGTGSADESRTRLMSLVYYSLLDRSMAQILAVSAFLGLAVGLIDGILTRILVAHGGSLSGRLVSRLTRAFFDLVPPLAIGVGALALVDLTGWVIGQRVARWLDPIQTPGLILIVATAAAHLPNSVRLFRLRRSLTRPELASAALAFGASKRQASRLARGRGSSVRSFFLVMAVAATSIQPALILSPTSDIRPLGPSILDALSNPQQAAALAILVVLINLLALAVAQDRTAPPETWFRGPS